MDNRIGLREPNDFITTSFELTGSFTVLFAENDSAKNPFDTPFKESSTLALTFDNNNNATTPKSALKIEIPNAIITAVDTDYTNDALMTQTVEFTALYDVTATKCSEVTLVNSTASFVGAAS